MKREEASLELWDELYDPSLETRHSATDTLVRHYQYLVEGIARKLQGRLPSYVEDDELVSFGQIGLLRAVSKYDPEKGPFSRYASSVVYGAIIDGLRAADFAPRGLRKQQRDMEKSIKVLQEKGDDPTTEEIADHMSLTVTEVRDLKHRIVRSEVVSVDPLLMGHTTPVTTSAFSRALCTDFVDWLKGFDITTQKVIALKYWSDLSINNISSELGIPVEQVREKHYAVLDSILEFARSRASSD